MSQKRPLVYDEVNVAIGPLLGGQTLEPDVIPVSGVEGNLIQVDTDGLSVVVSDFVSESTDNQLVVQDNRLFVASADPLVVSEDAGNYIRKGLDNGAYLDGNDILSNGGVNLLTINGADGKIILRSEDVRRYVTTVSDDEGNLLQEGSDGGAYASFDDLVAEDDLILKADDETGKLSTELAVSYNPTTGELVVSGVDGATISHLVIPTTTSALRGVQFADAKPDATGTADLQGTYYVTLAFKFDEEDVAYDGAMALAIQAQQGVTTEFSETYDLQTLVASGTFPDTVRATFLGESVEQTIEWGTTNTLTFAFSNGSTLVLTWGHSTGTQITFDVAFTPAIGILPGAWLRFVWLLADNSVTDMYVDVSKLIDVYVAGCGVSVTETDKDGIRQISVVLDQAGGLQCNDESGVALKFKDEGGLSSDEDGAYVVLDPDGGLQSGEDGVGIKTQDGGGLTTTDDGLGLVLCSSSGLTLTSDGCLRISVGNGLEVGSDGSLQVDTRTNGGISSSSSGVGIDTSWLEDWISQNGYTVAGINDCEVSYGWGRISNSLSQNCSITLPSGGSWALINGCIVFEGLYRYSGSTTYPFLTYVRFTDMSLSTVYEYESDYDYVLSLDSTAPCLVYAGGTTLSISEVLTEDNSTIRQLSYTNSITEWYVRHSNMILIRVA